jgi:molybdenum cofactor biosynthesis enzyme MoaA
MYCPERLHNSYSNNKSFEELQSYWLKIFENTQEQNLKYKISFTGGEITVNKNFLPFVIWLRQNYSDRIDKILVTTNGSASLNYYKKLFEQVDNISFSVHSEHIDEKKFFDTVVKLKKTLNPKKFVHVNIMNEFWNQERIPIYIKICEQNNISYSLSEIDYSLKTRAVPILKGRHNYDVH